jgi:hypothetical protein
LYVCTSKARKVSCVEHLCVYMHVCVCVSVVCVHSYYI